MPTHISEQTPEQTSVTNISAVSRSISNHEVRHRFYNWSLMGKDLTRNEFEQALELKQGKPIEYTGDLYDVYASARSEIVHKELLLEIIVKHLLNCLDSEIKHNIGYVILSPEHLTQLKTYYSASDKAGESGDEIDEFMVKDKLASDIVMMVKNLFDPQKDLSDIGASSIAAQNYPMTGYLCLSEGRLTATAAYQDKPGELLTALKQQSFMRTKLYCTEQAKGAQSRSRRSEKIVKEDRERRASLVNFDANFFKLWSALSETDASRASCCGFFKSKDADVPKPNQLERAYACFKDKDKYALLVFLGSPENSEAQLACLELRKAVENLARSFKYFERFASKLTTVGEYNKAAKIELSRQLVAKATEFQGLYNETLKRLSPAQTAAFERVSAMDLEALEALKKDYDEACDGSITDSTNSAGEKEAADAVKQLKEEYDLEGDRSDSGTNDDGEEERRVYEI